MYIPFRLPHMAFPPGYSPHENTLVAVPVALIPAIAGMLTLWQYDFFWRTPADYEQGRTAAALLQERLMANVSLDKLNLIQAGTYDNPAAGELALVALPDERLVTVNSYGDIKNVVQFVGDSPPVAGSLMMYASASGATTQDAVRIEDERVRIAGNVRIDGRAEVAAVQSGQLYQGQAAVVVQPLETGPRNGIWLLTVSHRTAVPLAGGLYIVTHRANSRTYSITAVLPIEGIVLSITDDELTITNVAAPNPSSFGFGVIRFI